MNTVKPSDLLFVDEDKPRDWSLKNMDPDLSKLWHPTKNKFLTAKDIYQFSDIRVWWLCKNGHEWMNSPRKMFTIRRCPYCSNKRACPTNCLATLNPELAKEWHPTMNGNLRPEDVVPGSIKRVWWLCKNGHKWRVSVKHRSKGSKCDECRSFGAKNPELAKEWHPIKNGKLSPFNVGAYSNKKVWWKCSNGHEFQMQVKVRNIGGRCQICLGRKAYKGNCLSFANPELAKQWHPTKNGSLRPEDVLPETRKEVWWICPKGHEWLASIRNRVGRKYHDKTQVKKVCPYCSNRRANRENCLATLNPKLSKEWHPSKNGSLTPWDIVPGSGKKVVWDCQDCGHIWKASIRHRAKRGSRCPKCVGHYSAEQKT